MKQLNFMLMATDLLHMIDFMMEPMPLSLPKDILTVHGLLRSSMSLFGFTKSTMFSKWLVVSFSLNCWPS